MNLHDALVVKRYTHPGLNEIQSEASGVLAANRKTLRLAREVIESRQIFRNPQIRQNYLYNGKIVSPFVAP